MNDERRRINRTLGCGCVIETFEPVGAEVLTKPKTELFRSLGRCAKHELGLREAQARWAEAERKIAEAQKGKPEDWGCTVCDSSTRSPDDPDLCPVCLVDFQTGHPSMRD